MKSENISFLIKLNREQKKLSQKELGKRTGIRHQIISRYENGAEIPTEEKLQLIFNVLDIDINEVDAVEKEINYLFSDFINDLFFREENYESYLIILYQNKEKYIKSHNYYKILIIEIICKILMNQTIDINRLFKKIERMTIPDHYALQIYYEYKVFYLLRNKASNEGLKYLKMAKLQTYDEKEIAMIYYHMSFAYNYEWMKLTNGESLCEARDIFQKYHSYKRVSDCEMILGNYYSSYRYYSKALKCYDNRLRLLKVFNEPKPDIADIYRPIAYNHLKMKKYNQALVYLKKADSYDQTDQRRYLLYIWSYYKLNNINEANAWIVKMKHRNLDKELTMLLGLYDLLVLQYDKTPSNQLVEKAIKVYEYYKKQDDLDLQLFYLDILLDVLERRKEYEKAFLYQKQKIFLLENI